MICEGDNRADYLPLKVVPLQPTILVGAATLGVSDSLLTNGEKAVAQNPSSQDEMVSRNSNNNFESSVGKSNITANSGVLSIVEQRTEMSSPAPGTASRATAS